MKRIIILTTLLLISITLSFAQNGGGRGKNIIKSPKVGANTGSGKKSTSTKGAKRSEAKSKRQASSKSSQDSKSSSVNRKSDNQRSGKKTASTENVNNGSFKRNAKNGKRKGSDKTIKNTQLNDSYRKDLDDLNKEAVFAKTDRAARRGVKRSERIPTSSQPIKTIRKNDIIEYHYRVPKSGGGSKIKIVQKSTNDRSHDIPHWEASKAKTEIKNQLKPKVRENTYGGAKINSDKSKIYVKDPKAPNSNN